jgi:hypothetical protein
VGISFQKGGDTTVQALRYATSPEAILELVTKLELTSEMVNAVNQYRIKSNLELMN